MSKKKIGILGGTFNPVHNAHIEMAELAMKELGLTGVCLMPDGDPPHKDAFGATAEDRLNMTRLAVEGHKLLSVSDREINRHGYTYTVDTMDELKKEDPDILPVLIIGADSLLQLRFWKDFARLAKLCSFFAIRREGTFGEKKCAKELKDDFGADVTISKRSVSDISSTDIRQMIECGGDWSKLVPKPVADYIENRSLYMGGQLSDFDRLTSVVRERLPIKRWHHTLGVIETAELYAERFGCDIEKAKLAALLHDCAKPLRGKDALDTAKKFGIEFDGFTLAHPEIWHGPLASAVAEKEFGITDREVLDAIARHTTGAPEMTKLDMILKLADLTEPGRTYDGVDSIRKLAETDLEGALLLAMRQMADYVDGKGAGTHPDSIKAMAMLEHTIKMRENR